jgi:hypothetical protein
MTGILPVPVTGDFAAVHYRPQTALVTKVQVFARSLPYLEVGTGGFVGQRFIQNGLGYQPYVVLQQPPLVEEATYAKLMEHVRAGFGRTMSRLPEVFGVSRQTLYNWMDGETPKLAHQERLRQLAEAAKVFTDLRIKPTTPMLDRTMSQGKTFLQLLASGADGKETAKSLIRIVQRGNDSRAKLDELLAGRKATLSASDLGAASFDESA